MPDKLTNGHERQRSPKWNGRYEMIVDLAAKNEEFPENPLKHADWI